MLIRRFACPAALRVLAFAALGVLLLALLSACAPTSPGGNEVIRDGDVVSGTGTIRHFDLEGGFYAIVGDDNVTYDPVNLSPDFADFQKPGLRVVFKARLQENQVGFHQAGPLVEILEIRRK